MIVRNEKIAQERIMMADIIDIFNMDGYDMEVPIPELTLDINAIMASHQMKIKINVFLTEEMV